MFILITPENYDHYQDELTSMFALRHHVFCQRLGWVEGHNGIERDAYDDLSPSYIIYRDDEDGRVLACVRLLPTTGPNMLRDTFPQLLGGKPAPEAVDIWESSRFAVDTHALMRKDKKLLSLICSRLFLAMIEFGLGRQLTEIVTVTDLRVEKIAKQKEWRSVRLGQPMRIGDVNAVALIVGTSSSDWESVKRHAEIERPVLACSLVVASI